MLIIAITRSHRLEPLRQAIAEYNKTTPPTPWGIFELERFDVAGIPVSRIALICDSMPPPEFDIPIEAVIDDRYCPECLKKGKFNRLPKHNKSGWCAVHQDKNPQRSERKKKKH